MVKIRTNDKKIMSEIKNIFSDKEFYELPKQVIGFFAGKKHIDEDPYDFRIVMYAKFKDVYEYLEKKYTFTYNPEMRCIQI